MNNNNRKDNLNSNYIYPQPYIDPMVYLNPYYSNAQGYQYNNPGYVDYSQFNSGYIDYSQFNDNQNNLNEQNYIKDENEEYTNIPPEEDFNIPYIPYFPPSNMPNNQQNIPNMILPNTQYQALPPNMWNQGMPNQNQQNMPPNQNQQGIPNQNFQNMNIPYNQMSYMQYMPYMGYIPMQKPMYPTNMFPNMYPEVFPNMMYPNYPFMNVGPNMNSVNMEEFDEEEM